jgi:hypothetical protein
MNDAYLDFCERIITAGLCDLRAVGVALEEICSRRLYVPRWKTFSDYCRGRWQMSRAQAYRLMQASRIVDVLSRPLSPNWRRPAILPVEESQCRELARAADPAAAWDVAVDLYGGAQPTAEQIRAIVDVAGILGAEDLAEIIGRETAEARARGLARASELAEEKRAGRLLRAFERLLIAVRWFVAAGLSEQRIRRKLEQALRKVRKSRREGARKRAAAALPLLPAGEYTEGS